MIDLCPLLCYLLLEIGYFLSKFGAFVLTFRSNIDSFWQYLGLFLFTWSSISASKGIITFTHGSNRPIIIIQDNYWLIKRLLYYHLNLFLVLKLRQLLHVILRKRSCLKGGIIRSEAVVDTWQEELPVVCIVAGCPAQGA